MEAVSQVSTGRTSTVTSISTVILITPYCIILTAYSSLLLTILALLLTDSLRLTIDY